MRRVHLRGHTNILKRLLIHTGGFNLGLLMRQLIGVGTPRGLQGRLSAVVAALLALIGTLTELATRHRRPVRHVSSLKRRSIARLAVVQTGVRRNGFHHGLLGGVADAAPTVWPIVSVAAQRQSSNWSRRASSCPCFRM